MADTYLNQFLAKGTAADRASFTPTPPTPSVGPVHAYLWWETDTNRMWAWDGSGWDQVASGVTIRTIQFVIDGGGSAITTGLKAFSAPTTFAGTITKVTVLSIDATGPATSGSIVVDIWKDSYGNFPPTVADTITASAKPTLSSATKSQDSTLTGWTTSVSVGDVFAAKVDSATTVTKVLVSLEVTT